MPQLSRHMVCDQVVDLIEAWIDGDLSDGEAEEMRRHVGGCPECRAEHQSAEEVRAALRRLPSFEAPAPLLDAVRSSTTGRAGSPPLMGWRSPRVARAVAGVAAIAVVVLLAGVILPRRQASPARPTATELARVTAETRLALAYLGDVVRRAESRAKARVIEDRAVLATITEVSSSLKWVQGPDTGTQNKSESEGSL